MSILHKIAVLAEHDISLITDSDMSSVQEELSLIWAKIWQWRKDEYERQKNRAANKKIMPNKLE